MKNRLIVVITLLSLAAGLNASCLNFKKKVKPAVGAVIGVEKRDNKYWIRYADSNWTETGHVQFYAALENKKMNQATGADGKPIYKIGEIEVNQESFKWVADRRKEHKKDERCVIS